MQESSGVLFLRGADFDWRNNGWNNPTTAVSEPAEEVPSDKPDLMDFPFLKGVQFTLQPGQLLGICGEVKQPLDINTPLTLNCSA